MNRLLLSLLLICSTASGAEPIKRYFTTPNDKLPKVYNFGWQQDDAETARVAKTLEVYNQQVAKLPYRDDLTALVYAYLCRAMNVRILPTLDQGPIGSCVGFATTRAAGITAAADILHRKESEEWVADFSPEALYAIGRQAAGRLGSWDGSTGAWAVEGLQKIGTLHRTKYEVGASPFDLTAYEPSRARSWASQGIPETLLVVAKEHPFLSAALVDTVDKAKASLQNGYPLITCSMISYPNNRDAQGFLPATGERWAHAMCVAAYRSRAPPSGREGFLILNSWAATSHDSGWVTGPIWPTIDDDFPQPIGSFWITPSDLEKHLSFGDTWAISGYEGFKVRELDWEEVFSQAGGVTRE